jgi:hypothetical protein
MRAAICVLLIAGVTVALEENHDLPRQVNVKVEATPASARNGGFGFVRVDVRNHGKRDKQIVSLVLDSASRAMDFEVRKSVALEPGASARVFLPLPGFPGSANLQMNVVGAARGRASFLSSHTGPRGQSVLLAAEWPGRLTDWPDELAQLANARRRRSSRFSSIQPRRTRDLPDRWQLLTGFDLIVVDGGSPALDAARQELLVRYVRAGGHLFVVGGAAIGEGPLADLVETPWGMGRHGMGGWFAIPQMRPDELRDRSRAWTLQQWLLADGSGPLAAHQRSTSGSPQDMLYFALTIPGLGKVPVRLFFILILAFAIAVGPVNYFYLRRRRKLGMLLVTVPVAGFGMTAIILTYGLFAEGFGIKGAGRSVSVLDQRSHEVVSAASRTVYAGIGPSGLTPAPGTYLFSNSLIRFGAFVRSADRTHRLDIDMDRGGRFGGGLVPSRMPTPLYTLHQGRARERLRFRRRDDSGLELLYAPEFAPHGGRGTVLLCDFDGAHWINREDGTMDRVPAAPDKAYEKLRKGYRKMHDVRVGTWSMFNSWMDRVLRPLDGGKEMARGTYIARMRSPPATDDLGLDVDYLAEFHIVRGILAKDDFVE